MYVTGITLACGQKRTAMCHVKFAAIRRNLLVLFCILYANDLRFLYVTDY